MQEHVHWVWDIWSTFVSAKIDHKSEKTKKVKGQMTLHPKNWFYNDHITKNQSIICCGSLRQAETLEGHTENPAILLRIYSVAPS